MIDDVAEFVDHVADRALMIAQAPEDVGGVVLDGQDLVDRLALVSQKRCPDTFSVTRR